MASIDEFSVENTRLAAVRSELEGSTGVLKEELEQLKGVIDLVGENQADVYESMLKLYGQYNAVVNLDVHSKAIGILKSLDTNSDFMISNDERTNAIKSLNLLFGHDHNIVLTNQDFDDLEKLKLKIIMLIKSTVKYNM